MINPFSIHKILIANRGEIALRIRRAADRLNIPTAVVYSQQERNASWRLSFEDSVCLGHGSLSDTYLNIDAILEAAEKTGADAIHPGYGFLAENHHFAKACESRQYRFIGPPSGVLKLMGDKLAAHDFVSSLGLPSVQKIRRNIHEINRMGNQLEYPLLVKAAAGGGGKAMRLVRDPGELTRVLEITASEAHHYFSDDRIYVEKYIQNPRHIEVQVIADSYGNVVHLFERDCSIQRRHQKIIEEAPARSISVSLREEILEASLHIARSAGYVNAGTLEFLVDDHQNFYFLEMNPRIQVEHGVTEMITGVDLVREQIRIAEGHPLSFTQPDISCLGHAIEMRIYAEDPENDLLPSTGRIHCFKPPAIKNIRVESSVASHDEIFPDFDPLLAKVIAYGSDRDEAIQLATIAVDHFAVTGVNTNLSLLRVILDNTNYKADQVSTTFLPDRMNRFVNQIATLRVQSEVTELLLASVAQKIKAHRDVSPNENNPWTGYWRNVPGINFIYKALRYDVAYRLIGNDALCLWQGEQKNCIRQIKVDACSISFEWNGVRHSFFYAMSDSGSLLLSRNGLIYEMEPGYRRMPEDYEMQDEELSTEEVVRSPLPGKIINLMVSEGDRVESGQPLITLESMKLENAILSPHAGIIQHIYHETGEAVKRLDPLLFIKPEKL